LLARIVAKPNVFFHVNINPRSKNYSGGVQIPAKIGPGAIIDDSVILNYAPGRKIPFRDLVIGRNARIRSNNVIYGSTTIGDDLETGHNVVIREENSIGDNFSIWNSSTIDYGCVIGDRVKIHCNSFISQYTTIESDVFLSAGVMVANDLHPLCAKCMEGPTIRRGARIGIGSILMPKIEIGERSLVAAGSLVTRDVPPRAMVRGYPAKVICKTDELECQTGMVNRPYFDGLDVQTREAAGKRVESENTK
jgi:acetyltransferase-like isoleucine patch superfamily enzyme